jgi:hypothetical protein
LHGVRADQRQCTKMHAASPPDGEEQDKRQAKGKEMVLAVGGHDHEQCEVRQQKSAPLLQWTISSERADNFPKELTTFPKLGLGTLIYSYAMNGNGHVIIWRKGHILAQYDQGDIEYVTLCLYGRRTSIRPGSSYHGTVL